MGLETLLANDTLDEMVLNFSPFLMVFDVALPYWKVYKRHSCIVGASPCGCPRGGLLAESFMVARGEGRGLLNDSCIPNPYNR